MNAKTRLAVVGLAAFGCAAILTTVPAWAGQAGAAAAASPASSSAAAPADSHEAAARDLVRITDLKRLSLQAGGAALDAQVKANPTMAPYSDIMHTWMERVFDEIDLETIVVDLYKEAFSEAELRDLIAFYRTPTGKKALTVIPDLAEKGMTIGMQKAQEHAGELREMMAQRDKEMAAKKAAAEKPADDKAAAPPPPR